MDADFLTIRPNALEPIYQQIAAQLRRLIASGQLHAGDELPSVRDVAVHHAINPMTVSRAYSQLEGEGLLERRRGRGMAVAGSNHSPQPTEARLDQLEPHLTELVRQARELKLPSRLLLQRLKLLLEDTE
jgi:GntR family transcriptional regulator